MPQSAPELWWAVSLGTVVLLAFAIGIIAVIIVNQRRFLAARKRQWEELQKREAQYRDLFNNVSDVVYIHSLTGHILQINLAITKLLGYEVKDLIGRPISELIDPQYQREQKLYLDEVRQKGESTGLIHLKTRGGEDRVFEYRSSLVSKEGEPVAVRGIARNVTEQRLAEKALRESEERFRRLLKYSPVPIAVNRKGRWVYVNDNALKLMGAQHSEQVLGKSLLFLVKSEARKEAKERIRTLMRQGGEAIKFVQNIVRLDGREIEVEVVALPIMFERVQAWQVVLRDVTEQKRLQEELARAQRLETAGRVAGQIAHDFNNLLAPLTAYPTLIREDLPADHPVLELVDEMEAAATKIADINQQLLTLARRGHYAMEAVDLNELLRKIVSLQRLPSQIVVRLDLAPDLFKIKGGSAQLTRALTNLIVNARDAMQGIGELTVTTENVYLDEPLRGYQTVEKGEYVRVAISDTGTGIDPAIMNSIFDPFFTTKRADRARGSGLGLSVVHGIIEDHHGYITVDSKVGEGTTFSLFFPIQRDIETEATREDGLRRGQGERILVVDDDPVQRAVAGQFLKRFGYEVHEVASGEEAVRLLRKEPHDLLLLDMVMEGIDGVETYRQVREFCPEQKAIIISGYAMSERVEEALNLGASTFVSKPLVPRTLAAAIRQALDSEANHGASDNKKNRQPSAEPDPARESEAPPSG